MSIGLLFWLLIILWLVFGFFTYAPDIRTGRYGLVGGNLLLFILLFLLGWKVFGFIIHS